MHTIHASHRPISKALLCKLADARAESLPVSEFLKTALKSWRCKACIAELKKLGRWRADADTKEEQSK